MSSPYRTATGSCHALAHQFLKLREMPGRPRRTDDGTERSTTTHSRTGTLQGRHCSGRESRAFVRPAMAARCRGRRRLRMTELSPEQKDMQDMRAPACLAFEGSLLSASADHHCCRNGHCPIPLLYCRSAVRAANQAGIRAIPWCSVRRRCRPSDPVPSCFPGVRRPPERARIDVIRIELQPLAVEFARSGRLLISRMKSVCIVASL
jgi:hypothetical protein